MNSVKTKAMKIIEKLDYLKRYDVHYLLFGSSEHRYELGTALGEQEISEFERRYQARLPEDYRYFLREVGNGGAGPGYGLYPLGKSDKPFEYHYLNHPFAFDSDIMLEEQEEQFECLQSDCGKCAYSSICYLSEFSNGEYIEGSRYQMGSMTLCFEGCTYYRRMVMNGTGYGEIWAESEGEGFKRTHASFEQWYTEWLERSVAIIRPYVEAVTEHRPFDEILALPDKGVGMFCFEHIKAEFVAGMLNWNAGTCGITEIDKKKYVQAVREWYDGLKGSPGIR